jgi:competence protein ComGC
MVQSLARLGSAALTIAEFALVLLALAVLGITTIPALVRDLKGSPRK